MTRRKDDFPVPPPHIKVRWHGGGTGGTDPLEGLSFFHESFPGVAEWIAGIANDVVADARGLDAEKVQDGACERLRLAAWRLWIAAQRAEEEVEAYYGQTKAPRRSGPPGPQGRG